MAQDTVSELLKQFYEDENAKRLVEKYCSPSIYDDVLKICHLEKLHTNFLIWLMQKGSEIPIFLQDFKELLRIICKKGMSLNCVSKDVKEIYTRLSNPNTQILLQEDDIKQEIKTSYRDKNKCQKNPRVDIVIDISICDGNAVIPVKIIIENKVFSREHDNQTNIYYGYFSEDNDYIKNNISDIDFYKKEKEGRKERVYNKKNGELQLFVFLHPVDYDFKNLAPDKCGYFIPISYQDLRDNLLIKKTINEFSETDRFYIEEYKNILIKPSTLTNKIMAKDSNDKENLKKFAEKYMSLFRLALKESDDNSKAKDSSDAIEQIVDGIDQYSAQRCKYNLIINEENTWDSLKMYEVAHHVVVYIFTEKKLSLKEINTFFPYDYWVCTKEEYNRRKQETKQTQKRFKRRWDEIRDLELYVNKEWTKDRFNDFAYKLQSTFDIIIEESN